MPVALHIAAGGALAGVGWLLPRRVAGAGFNRFATLVLDAAPLAAVAALLFGAGGRPIFAGLVVLMLGAGFALADRTTREALREPVLFTALSELPQVFTHPQLYLPFAGTGVVIGGAGAAIAAGLGLLVAEPAVEKPHPALAFAAFAALAVAAAALSRPPLLVRAAGALRRLHPSGEPFADTAALGPAAMLIAHGLIARAERPARRAALSASPVVSDRFPSRPILLVQCESFFDARRVLPTLPADTLPGYAEACRTGATFGRLRVSAWGANTTRAEFAVLTGHPEAVLGLDRFNPYHALARTPLASHVWRLRAAGYRTICLHPFDRVFFRRDLVMPALGFEEFIGRERLGGSRMPPYFPDPDLAPPILRQLEAEGPRVLIFVVTMGNHGPWPARTPAPDPALAARPDPEAVPQGGELLRYLDGLRRSDLLLSRLIDGLRDRRSDAVLGWYGDHVPALPLALAHFGLDDGHSDYVVWTREAAAPIRRDIAAAELGGLVIDIACGRRPACADAVVGDPPGA